MKVRKKILLIDHDTRVTHIVRRALETAGKYSIREEHDAAFAIRAARWFRPYLVMIDLTTSATDGTIIAKQLQDDQDLCDVPLVCLSNFVLERQFLSAGILRGYSFLAVPVDRPAFCARGSNSLARVKIAETASPHRKRHRLFFLAHAERIEVRTLPLD